MDDRNDEGMRTVPPGLQRSLYRPGRGQSYLDFDFDRTPVTVAWELTRACALACKHCRAMAMPRRDPRELTTAEGYRLIDQVVEIGRPILVVTGGDPLMRRDVFDLIAYAASRELRVALSPSATALVTRRTLTQAKEAGVAMLHVSLDGSTPEIHDEFRGVRGSYQRTIEILGDAVDLDLPLQVGTTVNRRNLTDLPRLAEEVQRLGATVWSVFFLVPTGRGQAADMVSPAEHEEVFHLLAELSLRVPLHVRTTAAPAYRRVLAQHMSRVAPDAQEVTGAGFSVNNAAPSRGQGVNDGRGFCFVSHTGDVCPSGFLPIIAGNVRQQSLTELYRDSPLFRSLRDPIQLKGKCGRCEYRTLCGGSRARAYALTGDYLASDPSCVYEPAAAPSAQPVGV